jgi:hypothetical protein
MTTVRCGECGIEVDVLKVGRDRFHFATYAIERACPVIAELKNENRYRRPKDFPCKHFRTAVFEAEADGLL